MGDFRDGAKFAGLGVGVWLLVLVLALGSGAAYMFVQPWFFKMERQNIQNSLQYDLTKVDALEDFKLKYEELQAQIDQSQDSAKVSVLKAQQLAFVRRMKQIRAELPEDAPVPADVLAFLATH